VALNRRFSLKKLGETTALGLVDVGFEKLNEAMGLTFPFDALTLGRAGLFVVGLAADALMNEGSRTHPYTETLWIAEEPLLIRTIMKAGGVIADYQSAPSRDSIELKLRQQGQYITPPKGPKAQFR
jgi:hypothetical protein